MKIYVVQGSTGEYSDHKEWLVCAFKDEKKAQELVVQLTQEGKVFVKKMEVLQEEDYEAWVDAKYGDGGKILFPPNDPNFEYDSGLLAFNYTYFEVELK
jgi:hypothetical protein